MKALAAGLEVTLKEVWTWVHLGRLVGVDVMAYHAVGEGGLAADADEAGPIYASDGFHLDSLSDGENLEALEAGRLIFATLRTGGAGHESRQWR
ncbi:hypothetical protein ACQ859_11080 [Roseateles chitinivorans]|uniref:hypothetical protein n=1 Tax=Roseateles chitinivorans TaxID=2917965 RepID=UPI003D66B4F9